MNAEDKDLSVGPTRAQRMLQRRVTFLQEHLSFERPLRILDVGANPINTPGYDGLHRLQACDVWGFEPEQSAFDALVQNARPNSHYLQKAIGKRGPATFYSHPQTGLGSTLQLRPEAADILNKPNWINKDAPTFDLELVALDDLTDHELPKPDLLKIDIQGGELDVFSHGRDKLDQAICVITEVRYYQMYRDEPMFGDLDCELRGQGFALHKLDFSKAVMVRNSQQKRLKKSANRNQMLDGDAIYVRNIEGMADWSTEQVKQLALAAASVFTSIDLCVHCLDHLVERGVIGAHVPSGFVGQLPSWMLES